jgi:hypothetical protein
MLHFAALAVFRERAGSKARTARRAAVRRWPIRTRSGGANR